MRRILRHHPLASVLLVTVALGIAKIVIHYFHFEPFSFGLSTLFAGALTGTIFLLGFILAGVLSDYKESERIPSEMVAALSSLWLEARIVARKGDHTIPELLRQRILKFIDVFRDEFLFQRRDSVFNVLDSFWEIFAALDTAVPPPLMARMQADHNNLRRLLSRIKTIRDTSFSEYGYLVLKVVIAFFVLAMLLLDIDPFGEGLFFLCFFSFVLIGVFRLIRDMDNPFEYGEVVGKDEVSFEELLAFREQVKNDELKPL